MNEEAQRKELVGQVADGWTLVVISPTGFVPLYHYCSGNISSHKWLGETYFVVIVIIIYNLTLLSKEDRSLSYKECDDRLDDMIEVWGVEAKWM